MLKNEDEARAGGYSQVPEVVQCGFPGRQTTVQLELARWYVTSAVWGSKRGPNRGQVWAGMRQASRGGSEYGKTIPEAVQRTWHLRRASDLSGISVDVQTRVQRAWMRAAQVPQGREGSSLQTRL